MKNRYIKFVLSFLLVSFIVSCGKEEEKKVLPPPSLDLNVSSVGLGEKDGDSRVVKIKSNVDWRFEVRDDGKSWCHPYKKEDKLIIVVDANDQKGVRQTEITIIADKLQKSIKVSQLGWGKAILLSEEKIETEAIGGAVVVEVTTNIEFKCVMPENCNWIKKTELRSVAEHPEVVTPITFIVEANKNEEQRSAEIVFKDVDESSELNPVAFTVIQKGIGEYSPLDPEEIKDDIQVKVTGGYASSFQADAGIEKSFDGDKKTMYHSNWNNSAEDYFPITLEYYFEKGSDMDYFIYYPRIDGFVEGCIGVADIEVKHNANARGVDEWEKVMTYDFGKKMIPTRVDFPQSQIGVSAVRLIVQSGAGWGQGVVNCAEMEFYKKNPANFNWETLFADPSCSELKPGITEQEILNCTHSFFKNIAYYMYLERYAKEFRINNFRAYPHPDVEAKKNKTSTYNLLDNPTGISVNEGDILIVMAGDLQGRDVNLRVQNLDKPNGDGYGGAQYPITTGINKLKIEEKGLIYVMYHPSDYQSAPDIRLHFATGNVNGYFDSQNQSHEGRWQELLNNATNKYFDVLGKYAHLTFPTEDFRKYTNDLKNLIDIYDRIVYNEQMLMGLQKYDRMFTNRMYFYVIYTSYMYATSNRTAYVDWTMKDLCDENILSTTACWGPSHEVGHVNQTRPGLRWWGTTEVTNNILAQYIRTTILNQPSGLQTEDMGSKESPNRYSMAWNNILVKEVSHAQEEDPFCKLIPFWQLELYFGKVKGMTPLQQADKGGFYPEVFEYVRINPDLPTAGEQQLEFVVNASKAAGMNLLDFFEKWGFLTPVDMEIDDYGKSRFTVTEEQVDEIRRRVEALGYAKPDVALEYITDNTVEVFKKQAAIIPGTASRNGNQLTMQNWQNVIVYEVRENGADGKLICASDGVLQPSSTASFNVLGGWKDNYKVYAVSYDNKRVEVTFS